MWEFVFNQPEYDYDAVNVTAKCSCCGEPMFDNPAVIGWDNRKNGTVIWRGFITNYKAHEEQARIFALQCAESVRKLLPKYCAKCGKEMRH